jgi:hypothetical protein
MKITSSTHHWDWFKKHNDIYLNLPLLTDREAAYWINELKLHVRSYCHHLFVDIKWTPDLTAAMLVITADNNFAWFQKAEQFVDKATPLPNWTFHALYPPFPLDYEFYERNPDTIISPHQLYFSPEETAKVGDKFKLMIYAQVEGVILEVDKQAVDFVLLNVLGEKSATLDIQSFNVQNLHNPSDEKLNSLVHISELQKYIVSNSHSKLIINDRGMLTAEVIY